MRFSIKKDKVKEDNESDVSDDKNDFSKVFKFSSGDLNKIKEYRIALNKDIYSLNTQITWIIDKWYKKLELNKPTVPLSYSDIRVLYEELINIIIYKYMVQCHVTKRYYMRNEVSDYKEINPDDEYNSIDFNPSHYYEFTTAFFRKYIGNQQVDLLISNISKTLVRICVANNEIIKIEMKYMVKNLSKYRKAGDNKLMFGDLYKNDYYSLFNIQMYKTTLDIIKICNICKNLWLKSLVNLRNIKSQNR